MLNSGLSRRGLLKAGAAAAGALALPTIVPGRVRAAGGTRTINMQLGWLGGGNQLGEVAAKHLGYFEEEKLDFVIQPGGPNIDGVAIVASGRYEIGQVSSSPSLMLAASQGIPVKSFAVSVQEHPYAFFSLGSKPIKTAKDMVGRKIGIQATGKVLLSALLRKHDIPESDVEVVVVGADMTPLVSGQVDAVTGWLTNTTAIAVLGEDRVAMKLWDNGVQLYANPYYATTAMIEGEPEVLAGFLRAAARGWEYAYSNREAAVDLLLKDYPNLVKADEVKAADVLLEHMFTAATAKNGWGTFDPTVWQAQITLYDELEQFSAGAPKLEDVVSAAILDATAAARPKIG
ncbi:ABC transporter substrate-binding protein [Mesorhizobium sp. 1B3]|uniref:ABC transporter substrate-binding protein n=1 Tax=Mesorhizobium sp. 1B3 TaxID=3243599 RepID=UPI003D96290F